MSTPDRPPSLVSLPLATRLGIEIPKPKDWQAFQRNCVLLFRDELRDPHAQEYGRSGQKQQGIDILACRNGEKGHYVGVQCRLVRKPLSKAKILSDARATLAIGVPLKELIFATTAPDDTKAMNAALDVQRLLESEGHDIRIVVWSWQHLQNVICLHDVAYNAFHPSAVSTSMPLASRSSDNEELAAVIATKVVEQLRSSRIAGPPLETTEEESAEDPTLHAKIDTYRDLFKDQSLPLLAQKGLLDLAKQDLSAKPWARYRIETILASIELDLGREREAAERFIFAHSLRSANSNAIANLALAQTILGEHNIAMQTAQKALEATPPAVHAVSYLLQAAARSNWAGNPESLVPVAFKDTVHADFGLADFQRRREQSGWQKHCIETANRHLPRSEFKLLRATAVLALLVENPANPSVDRDLVSAAAEDMLGIANRCLDIGFADRHDLLAHVNNAALLLRFAGRHQASEELLKRGITACGDDAQLRRLLALAQFAQGRAAEAISTLANDSDSENSLLRAEFLSSAGDAQAALAHALAVSDTDLPERLRRLRWNILGELSIALANWKLLDDVVRQLRSFDPHGLAAELLLLRKLRRQTHDRKAVQEMAQALVEKVDDAVDMVTRFDIASEAYRSDLPNAAAELLREHVDLHNAWPPTYLYLESLAAARRDKTFREELARASDEIRRDPRLEWIVATHEWNTGELDGCLAALKRLLGHEPRNAEARLLKIEVLIRQDKSSELLEELDFHLESLDWKSPRDKARLASLLGHFGHTERAAALAYRLFLEHRDLSRSWMTLSAIMLDVGNPTRDEKRWTCASVGPDAAVDLRFDDGAEQFFVIEADASIRKLDESSWEPSHKLAVALQGLERGARFTMADGRGGVITEIRHKYVARLHFVLKQYEARFPTVFGVKQIPVDVEKEGGLDNVIAELQSRRDWVGEQEERYSKGGMPIDVFAKLIGVDPIEAAAGIGSQGWKLRVATGAEEERAAAFQAIEGNRSAGCILDLVTYWTAQRLKSLPALVATCGHVHVTQSVVDQLRARKDKLAEAISSGASIGTLVNGKFAIIKTPPEQIALLVRDVDEALRYLAENATILPLVVSDDLPEFFREALRKDNDAVFHSLAQAVQNRLLFITDDLAIRRLAISLGVPAAWLHAAFGVACQSSNLDFDMYVRWSADLAIAGQSYLGVTGPSIARAARLDFLELGAPGPRTMAMSGMLGGKEAEPRSHADVAVVCMAELWNDQGTRPYRQPVASQVLRDVTRDRAKDSREILNYIERSCAGNGELLKYIAGWRVGHFLKRLS